jgi:CubicO group peptidase (beta-lactamase class C family)
LRFTTLVEREVLGPLGLRATGPDVRDQDIPQRARTYSVSSTGTTPAPEDDLSGRWPSGGYLSSTDDLVRLGQSVLGPGLLDSASLRIMLTPQQLSNGTTTRVGIGWRVSVDSAGRRYLHHGGTSNGGSAFLLVYPEEQLVVAVASNAFTGWGERDVVRLAGFFLRAARPRNPG